jgi:hypothetical protein
MGLVWFWASDTSANFSPNHYVDISHWSPDQGRAIWRTQNDPVPGAPGVALNQAGAGDVFPGWWIGGKRG